MSKQILVDATCEDEIRIVSIQEDKKIIQFEQESKIKKRLKGNIYLGIVTRIEQSLQAAFVEYGAEKQGFLPFSDILPHYYQVSPERKRAILERSSEESHKPFNIQTVIQVGQELLVQVLKEGRGNKGVSFTTQATIAGRYCILTPYSSNRNIARSVSDENERARLTTMLQSMKTGGPGLILRAFASGKRENNIYHDYKYLCELWDRIQDRFTQDKAPFLLHRHGGLMNKILCDYSDDETISIIVDGSEFHQQMKDKAKEIIPHDKLPIRLYRRKTPIFEYYEIEQQISELYNSRASLPSGGYLVINPTEALVSIDVNSGKMTDGTSIEDTAYKTNLEATYELARQVELRGLSGLIVIDFIDMIRSKNCKLIKSAVEEAFSQFNSYVQISELGSFGLMAISKQRTKKSIFEFGTRPCLYCNGMGHMQSCESLLLQILRSLHHQASDSNIQISAPEELVLYIFNQRYERIKSIEQNLDLKINLIIDRSLDYNQFEISTIKPAKDYNTNKRNNDSSELGKAQSWFKKWLSRFL